MTNEDCPNCEELRRRLAEAEATIQALRQGQLASSAERKQAEAALTHSHDLMRYVIEHNRSAVAVHDRDLKYIYVSQRYLHDYNVKEKDVIGRHHYEVFPDLPRKWKEVHQRALAGEILSAEDDPYLREDGTVEWTRWECRPWYEATGSIGGIIIYTEVVTERKRVEKALQESEERYRILFQRANDGIFLMSSEGRLISVNESFARMHGYSPEEMMRMNLRELDTPATYQLAESRIRRLLAGEALTFEVEHYHRDGHIFPLEVSASMVSYGGQSYIQCFHRDISERKRNEEEKTRLEAQLQQSQKMESIGRLAGGIAHDFNNMLGVILGRAEMAMDQVDAPSPLQEDLEEIQKAAQRSADLTGQLLAFARKQAISPKVLDLNETVASMLKMLQRLIGENIELVWNPGPGLWPIVMDSSQIDQILANLAVNARDAISGAGQLVITTSNTTFDAAVGSIYTGVNPGDYVQLEVRDTGAGMDRETLDHIFEPFFTTKETGKGTGLGLAMVYGAVRQNHGFIKVSSEPGRGAAFKIWLPRANAQPVAPAVPPPAKATRGTETILVVEDEPAILKLCVSTLKKQGYLVLGARTPAEALAMAGEYEGQIHLLITDVVMPGMNGHELKNRLVALRPELKVLFISGYTAEVITHQGVIEQGLEFLQKPFSVTALAQKVRELL